MKTFYIGNKIDTNIPIGGLTYQFKIYNTGTKRYIPFFMENSEKLPNNREARKTYSFQQEISKEEAGKCQVWLYLYRSWQASKPHIIAYANIGSLLRFTELESYKNIKPLRAYESKGQTQKQTSNQATPTEILNISHRNIFVTPEYPSGHPNDPFRKETIETELRARLQAGRQSVGIGYPDQERSSLCGPAAYFYCLLKDRPDLYKTTVKELWEDGRTRIGNLEIKAGDAAKPQNFFDAGKPRILGLDWITMGSLRDSENFTWNYDSPTKEMAAITTPMEMYQWLHKSGAVGIKNMIALLGNSLNELVAINKYALQGHKVVQLMSSPNIFRGATTPNFKAHWIVWESPLKNEVTGGLIDNYSRLTERVDLKLFTWGWVGNLKNYNNYTGNISLKKFLDASFGAIVFKEIK